MDTLLEADSWQSVGEHVGGGLKGVELVEAGCEEHIGHRVAVAVWVDTDREAAQRAIGARGAEEGIASQGIGGRAYHISGLSMSARARWRHRARVQWEKERGSSRH
jgi:hypothetical protein